MDTATPKAQSPSFKDTDFERVTRAVRWAAIAVVLVTLPFDQPRVWIIYALALGAIIFNLTRHSQAIMRWRAYASPILVLTVDSIFIASLVAVVGDISTPYTGFFIFTIVTASYKFGLRGALTMTGIEVVLMAILAQQHFSPPMTLSMYRNVIVTAFVLLALGLLVERLTRSDRQQREDLVKLNRESQTERSYLLALLNSINDAVYVVDKRGHIVQHNETAASLVDQSGSDFRGKPFIEALPVHTRTEPDASPIDILKDRTDSQHRRDLTLQGNMGALFDLDIQVTPIALAATGSSDYIVVVRDITKERTLDEQRKEFISVTSHELRTPLAIMEGALSSAMAGKDKLPEQVTSLLEQAHRNSLYLGGIVKDLRMLSEAQNDNLPVELTRIYPQTILDQIVGDFEAQAKQQGLTLSIEVADNIPKVLSTENHIREILQNYVNNALKYTKQGTINIKAAVSKDRGILFSVTDSGIGISAPDQRRLFKKFFRAEDYRTRQTGGTGLGLYLCQELANRLNAKVWAESKLNHGSTFYLEIPPFSQLERDRGEVTRAQVSSLVDEL